MAHTDGGVMETPACQTGVSDRNSDSDQRGCLQTHNMQTTSFADCLQLTHRCCSPRPPTRAFSCFMCRRSSSLLRESGARRTTTWMRSTSWPPVSLSRTGTSQRTGPSCQLRNPLRGCLGREPVQSPHRPTCPRRGLSRRSESTLPTASVLNVPSIIHCFHLSLLISNGFS